jgi:YVTN family beta-propeller protein
VTNSYNKTVSIIDVATNKVTATVNLVPKTYEAYITNQGDNTVSVIDTATNNIIRTVDVGSDPLGVAFTPDRKSVYVTNFFKNTVSVIDKATNNITATVKVGSMPFGVAVNPARTKVYVVNWGNSNISVIDTATNEVTDTVKDVYGYGLAVSPDGTKVYLAFGDSVIGIIDTTTNKLIRTAFAGNLTSGVAIKPDGTKVYVSNYLDNTVSVLDTSTYKVIKTVPVGKSPYGVAVTPDGTKVYVANYGSNNVSVIDTANDTPIATVNVGYGPRAFGQFIVPPPVVLPNTNFSTNVTSGFVPLTVQFTDLSTNATGRNWDFGDGNFSRVKDPSHKYTIPGNYIVNLTATNAFGNTSTSAIITVKAQKLTADFSASQTSGTVPLKVKFTDRSTDSPTSWNWKFGNSRSSTQKNPVNTYWRVGKYTVSLKVKNALGQSDSVTKQNYINVRYPATPSVTNFSATPLSRVNH